MSRINTAFKRFDKAIADFGKDLTAVQYPVFHKKLATDALKGIVLNTPVLTGRLRGDWQVSLGAPVEGNTGILDKSKDGQSTVNKGIGIINQVPLFGVIYITNNLPYVIAIEEGASTEKSPQGMVAITLERLSIPLEGAV